MAAKRGNRLADEDVEIGIALSRRGIEHIYRSEGGAIGPAVGGDPAGVGSAHRSTEFSRQSMSSLGREPLLRLLKRNVGAGKLQGSAERVIEGCGKVGGEFVLQYDPHAAGVEIAARVGKSAGGQIGQQESIRRCHVS